MTTLTITMPDDMASYVSNGCADKKLASRLSLPFIIDEYRQGNITLKKAYTWADMSEVDFLTECQKRGVSRQTYISEQDLKDELEQLAKDFTVATSCVTS